MARDRMRSSAEYNLGFLVEFIRGLDDRVKIDYITAEQALAEIRRQADLADDRFTGGN